MADPDKLTHADPAGLVSSLAFALRFEERKRKHDADDFMAHIVAQRLVRHVERSVTSRNAETAGRRPWAVYGAMSGKGRLTIA